MKYFERRGIERRNKIRIGRERQAQAVRTSDALQSRQVDTAKPMFNKSRPSIGGGAFDPLTFGIGMILSILVFKTGRGKNRG